MIDRGYSDLVAEHFDRPRNVGAFAPGPGVICGHAGSPEQGAQFKLTARVVEGRIAAARFQVFGCPHCVAAGSILTEILVGKDENFLRTWSWRDLAAQLQLPTTKRGRFLILEDVVRAMADDWARRF
jgi:NifU-like protein involved in Fe-S cluster formation